MGGIWEHIWEPKAALVTPKTSQKGAPEKEIKNRCCEVLQAEMVFGSVAPYKERKQDIRPKANAQISQKTLKHRNTRRLDTD